MVIEVRSSLATALGVLRFVLLAFATLVIAHDAVYLQSHGPEAASALDRLGHAGHRPVLVVAAAIAATALIAWTTIRLATLSTRLRHTGDNRRAGRAPARAKPADRSAIGYRVTLVRLWASQALVVIPAFVVQENLEHRALDGVFPGLDVLVGPHAGALPTLMAVSGVMSAIGALVRWQVGRLNCRLACGASVLWGNVAQPSRPARAATIDALLIRHRWLLARRTPGRAPPSIAA